MAAPLCIDPAGYPTTVVSGATTTGTGSSRIFSILSKQAGTRQLWLSMGPTSGTVSSCIVDIQASFDGGTTYRILQSGIDLVNAPSQQVTPPPSPGASLIISIDTLTGSGATVNIIASSN